MLLDGQPYHQWFTHALHCPEIRVKWPTPRQFLQQLSLSKEVDSGISQPFVMDHCAGTPEYIIHVMMLHLE